MKKRLLHIILNISIRSAFFSFIMPYCIAQNPINNYKGIPYSDSKQTIAIQSITGKLECEFYDLGGESIAYHDNDSINSGSGNLNKGTYFNSSFRKYEAVDISFTKFHDSIDNSIYSLVQPQENQLYLGWKEPGKWTKYTMDVKTDGLYRIGLMYTANADGQISITINDKDEIGPIDIPSTFNEKDPVSWRQWHHWNLIENISEIKLKKGIQILTLHTVMNDQMNYDFLSFTYINAN